jgi:hypothetical protein
LDAQGFSGSISVGSFAIDKLRQSLEVVNVGEAIVHIFLFEKASDVAKDPLPSQCVDECHLVMVVKHGHSVLFLAKRAHIDSLLIFNWLEFFKPKEREVTSFVRLKFMV